METKILEIRDEATFISVLAIRMAWGTDQVRRYYFRRCGYPPDGSSIVVMRLSDCKSTNDPYDWPSLTGDNRTMVVAHEHILTNWDSLKDGDVIDVRVIIGEAKAPAVSERLVDQFS